MLFLKFHLKISLYGSYKYKASFFKTINRGKQFFYIYYDNFHYYHNKGDNNDTILEEAFTDLTKLMNNAKEMVELAAKLREVMLKNRLNDSDGDKNDNKDSDSEITDWLLQMGMTIPVTKQSTGARFHQVCMCVCMYEYR